MDHRTDAEVAERAARWLEWMMPERDGSAGVYERYMVSQGRVNPWIRPDCCMEVARAFHAYGRWSGQDAWGARALSLVDYVLSLQRTSEGLFRGSFPFYVFRPERPSESDIGDAFGMPDLPERAWPNDNGKVAWLLLRLQGRTRDERMLEGARKCLEYLLRVQVDDGSFAGTPDGREAGFEGVDFVAWPTMALADGARMTGDERYAVGARRGLTWLKRHQHPTGRALTSYETARIEAWRPPSSETAVALAALARGVRLAPEETWVREAMDGFGQALLALQHESGGMRNCSNESCGASLQNDPDVTDLVYTDGYALLALLDAFEATKEPQYVRAAQRLAAFLASIQCRGEPVALAGSWRGSYHLERQTWYGRADQLNPLDEGGMDTAYTGWTCAPVLYGLVRLAEMVDAER